MTATAAPGGTSWVSPRETMGGLPRIVQPFLTWVSGVPLQGTGPVVRWRPVLAALAGVVQTAAGIALGWWALGLAWPLTVPLLVLAWLTTAGGMRRLDVVVVHQTLHKMFTESDGGNRWVSEVVTTLMWRPPFDENRKEHLLHHAYPCSLRDGDTQYLQSTGARPGLSQREFRRYVWRTVFSPRHHWTFLSGRVKANTVEHQPLYRRLMVLVTAAALVVALVTTGWWLQWLLLWVVPVTFFFHNQTFLYTLSEHRWWQFDNAERLTKPQRDQLTFGRFCGRPAPQEQGWHAVVAWTGWWLRMVFVYAPYRMFVLVGDTVQHDLHHVRPKCDWAISSHVRAADVTAGSDRYYEVWGGLMSHVYAGNSVIGWDARSSTRPAAEARPGDVPEPDVVDLRSDATAGRPA